MSLAPVDECEALVKDIGTMHERLGPAFATSFSTAVQGGTFEGQASATIDAATQNELKALAQRVLQVVAALKAAPEEAAALASDVAAALARIPELVVRGTASTQVTLNNPFASAEEKASAQAEAQKLEAAPRAIVALLQNAQQQLLTLPPRAIAALESLISASALDANTLAVAAATATPTASSSATTVGRPSMGSEREFTISAHEALGRIGPWIGAAVATGRARLKRAEAARQALASSMKGIVPDPKRGIDRAWFARGVNAAMLGQPVPPLLDQLPVSFEITEQIKQLAQSTLTSVAELAAMQREMSKVRETIDETRAALPAISRDDRSDWSRAEAHGWEFTGACQGDADNAATRALAGDRRAAAITACATGSDAAYAARRAVEHVAGGHSHLAFRARCRPNRRCPCRGDLQR